MKPSQTLLGAAFVVCALFTNHNLSAQSTGNGGGGSTPALKLLSPTNTSSYTVGSGLSIRWTHNPANAGKTVRLLIELVDMIHATLSNDASVRIADQSVSVAVSVPSEGSWHWDIPATFPPGDYRLAVSEYAEGDPPGGSYNSSVITIRPIPAIKFASRYGSDIRIGSFPKFTLMMRGAELGDVSLYLRKDGKTIGKINQATLGYSPSIELLSVEWDLARYATIRNLELLPAPGTGYSVFAGIRKEGTQSPDEVSFTTEAFADFDETARFTLTPAAPLVIKGVTRVDSQHQVTMYYIGEVGKKYAFSYAPELNAAWDEPTVFIASAQIIPVTVMFPKVFPPRGFFSMRPAPTVGLASLSNPNFQKELRVVIEIEPR